MPNLTTTQLNPGGGGANVVTDQQSTGAQMPVSELAVSPDGVQDSKPVTGQNPLPVAPGVNPNTGLPLAPSVVPAGGVNEQAVYDARAAAARDELRVNIQAIVDMLTTSVLQVAAKIAGLPAGSPDALNMVGVQGAPGAFPVPATIQAPAASGGTQASVAPFNASLRATPDPLQLFVDSFDTGAFDTTNRWATPVAVGGGVIAPATVSASQAVGTGTTASGYSYIQTQPLFHPESPGYLVVYNAVNLEFPRATNGLRFWGIGTVPASPTTALPITDGAGWQIGTDGKLYAVLYQSGNTGPTLAVDLSTRVQDAAVHKYFLYFRGDAQYWAIDNPDNVVLVQPTGAPGPNVNTLPYTMIAVAGSTPPGSSLALTTNSIWVGDTSASAVAVSDGVYPWRQTVIKAPGTAPTAADTAIVVAASPNAPLVMASPGSATPIAPHVVTTNGLNEIQVFDARAAASLDELRIGAQSLIDLLNAGPTIAAPPGGLPAKVTDGNNTLAVPAHPVVVSSFLPGFWPHAQNGQMFVATNPTVGTGIAYATQTSFSNTVAGVSLCLTPAAGPRVYPQVLRMVITTAYGSSTQVYYAITLDSGAKRTSGGTALTIARTLLADGSLPASGLEVLATPTLAAANSQRVVARGSFATGAPGIGSEHIILIGHAFPQYSALATANTRSIDSCPPIVLNPGNNETLMLNLWAPAGATVPAFEWEVTWVEAAGYGTS